MNVAKRVFSCISYGLLTVAIILCAVLLSRCSLLGNDDYNPPYDSGYTITDYNIDIDIDEKGVYHIDEYITADFHELSHGLVRRLPTTMNVGILDKNGKRKVRTYNCEIKKFSSNRRGEYEDSDNFRIYYLYASNYGESVIGTYDFHFSYDYSFGDDRVKDKDFVYFNVLGDTWDTDIENFTYSITLPTAVENSATVYYGGYGEDTTGTTLTSPDGRTFSGSYTNINYATAVTVYLDLEEGYFSYTRESSVLDYIVLFGAGILLVATIVIILKYRRKDPIIDVVEFSSPDGMTPTEVGYLVDQKVDGEDVSALILYWASKGYVRIINKGEKTYIDKVKDLPKDAKRHEKILFGEIFKDSVPIDCEEFEFNNVSTSIKFHDSITKDEKKYFEKKGRNAYAVLFGFAVVLAALSVFRIFYQSHSMINFFSAVITLVVVAITLSLNLKLDVMRTKINKVDYLIKKILLGVAILSGVICFSVMAEAYCDPYLTRLIVMIFPIALYFFSPFLEIYTKEGRLSLGKVRGLRRYIEVAEKDRMIALVESDPSVFYNVLPYATVLGVTDVYMDKFKGFELPNPEWFICDADTIWTMAMLRHINIRLTIFGSAFGRSYRRAMVDKMSRSGGGGISIGGGGGGFSGGGFGGGGGGRF